MGDGTVRIGVLDLGSNSFHMSVADTWTCSGRSSKILPVVHARLPVGLERLVAHDGRLGGKTARRIAHAAHRLSERMGATDPHRTIVVATDALRELQDRSDLVRLIETATGLGVRLLSGREEAALVFLASRSASMLDGMAILSADLGGGSLEVALGDGALSTWTTSLPLGSAKLAAAFLDEPGSPGVDALTKHVHHARAVGRAHRYRGAGPVHHDGWAGEGRRAIDPRDVGRCWPAPRPFPHLRRAPLGVRSARWARPA